MRRELSGRVVREELGRAAKVLARHPLPKGIRNFELETDEDQDGDPVMWVWLDEDDSDDGNALQRQALADFMAMVKRELYDALEEYRPHFRIRTVSHLARVSSP